MKKVNVDVMVQGGVKFYCTLAYPFNPLFKLDFEDVAKFVYEKRPTLKYRQDVVILIDNIKDNDHELNEFDE